MPRKCIIFIALFCLLIYTTELYAQEPKQSNLEKQEAAFSLDFIVKGVDGAINGLGKSLEGVVNGLGESLDGTVNDLGKTLDETLNGLGDLLEGIGEVAEEVAKVAIVVGVVFLYITVDGNFYYYGCGYH